MTDQTPETPREIAREPVGGRFLKGVSANPRGKPKGARNHALRTLDRIGEDAAPEVLAAVVTAAIAGDMKAAELILSRIWPVRKGRVVDVDLPEMRCAADLPEAIAAVAQSVSDGDLTPDEGQAVIGIVEAHRRAIETADLEARIAEMEGNGSPAGGE